MIGTRKCHCWSFQRGFIFVAHNRGMVKALSKIAVVLILGICFLPGAFAQDSAPAKNRGDSSEQVEQREDSYRRQMELQDARSGEKVYIDTTYAKSAKSEKLNALPEESRDSIRDQLVDVIVANGEWKPSDALREYPYQPTAGAEADPALMELEQAAWDEQIEKYHTREAAAFGAYRGRAPGPGNPDGPEGGQQGEGSQGQEGADQSDGQGGQSGGKSGNGEEEEDKSGSAGTYQPYQAGSSSSENEVSTAGVSESALDFLTGGRTQAQPAGQDSQAQNQAQAQAQAQAQEQAAQQSPAENPPEESAETSAQLAEQESEQESSEQQPDSTRDVQLEQRGIIAIKDLDKLEGTETPAGPEDPEDP